MNCVYMVWFDVPYDSDEDEDYDDDDYSDYYYEDYGDDDANNDDDDDIDDVYCIDDHIDNIAYFFY